MKKNVIVVNSENNGWVKSICSTTYDVQIVEVEDLGITFEITRLNNDVNGNPRVRVIAYKNYQEMNKENVTKDFKGVAGRFYKKSEKIITQCFETKNLVRVLVNFYKKNKIEEEITK